MMQRSLNQAVRLTVATVPTSHPAGTVGHHWFWEVATSEGVTAQQQTPDPVLETALPPGSYAVSARLETIDNQPIGATAEVALDIVEQDVIIQTAGSITVEMP